MMKHPKILAVKVANGNFVGKYLPGNKLVQCLLPDDRYRVVSQKGFAVLYEEVTSDEVAALLGLSAGFKLRNSPTTV